MAREEVWGNYGQIILPDPVGNVLECLMAVKYENTSSTDILNYRVSNYM
jgi:hypothetical protein